MALTIKNIIPRKQAETSATIQYTSTGVTTVIDKFTVTNTSVSDAYINVYLPNSGSSPSVSNIIINGRTLGARETYSCPELVGQVIPSGGYISTLAGTSNALTISASGTQIV
mgnify:FL=1|jgi:hypothetical protein